MLFLCAKIYTREKKSGKIEYLYLIMMMNKHKSDESAGIGGYFLINRWG
jgi:hypothetical protein